MDNTPQSETTSLPAVSYTHRQFAHCESGVSSQLIQHAGLPMSEAMVFGIGSGIFFAHLPFVKIMGLPLTSYRSMPSSIFKKCCKRLGVPYKHKNFSNPESGQSYLNALLADKKIVALQTNIYWLPYIPERFRFPFNAHNIIVYGKEETAEGNYLVSDPVLEGTALCPPEAMSKARFAKGVLSPKGFLYYVDEKNIVISPKQLRTAIYQGLKESVHRMLFTFIPFFGVGAIKNLAKNIRKWHQNNDARRFSLMLTHVIRMQEEIGTGGAGFRFLFARFLEESAQYFQKREADALLKTSKDFLVIGDKWRQWALQSVRLCKPKEPIPQEEIDKLCGQLMDIFQLEKAAYAYLHKNFVKGYVKG